LKGCGIFYLQGDGVKEDTRTVGLLDPEDEDTTLRIIGDYPTGTPIFHLHDSLNTESL
jgi:hypothetical protein